jgi:hypothetical protein
MKRAGDPGSRGVTPSGKRTGTGSRLTSRRQGRAAGRNTGMGIGKKPGLTMRGGGSSIYSRGGGGRK